MLETERTKNNFSFYKASISISALWLILLSRQQTHLCSVSIGFYIISGLIRGFRSCPIPEMMFYLYALILYVVGEPLIVCDMVLSVGRKRLTPNNSDAYA